MSASSDYLRVLTDITREGGATRAATARANAQIWGGTVAKLGDFASEAIKQYSVDKKAKKQEQEDQAFKDLFARSAQEFQAQQQPSMAELTQQPGQETTFTGPELKTARAPRSSPFPNPSEILAVYPPQKAIPVINAIAALHKLDPNANDTLKLEQLQTIYKGLDKIPEDQRAAYFPGLIEGLEQVHYLPPGQVSKEYNPATWGAIGNSLKVTPTTAKADYTLGGQRFSGETNTPIATATVPSKPETPPNLGSFEDYVTRWASGKGKKPEELTTADIESARKAYNQSDDRPPSVNVSVGPNGAVGTLDADGLELAATDYRLTHRLPARNAQQNGAIISKAAAQAKTLGNTPVATIQKQAAYAGDAKALTKMQGMAASAEAFESKALAQTDIIKELSKKVPRTSYPIINSALQSGRTKITGDENATQLANAIETFSEEYAKIMNGTTGGSAAATDSARSASKRLINTAMSQGQMTSVLDLMTKEMNLTLRGYDSVIGHITDRMGGTSVPTAPAGTAPSKDPLGDSLMADTLAQKIRAKYPGVYDDLNDTDLEAKVTAKYPGVYDDIPKTATAAPVSAKSVGAPTPPSASDAFLSGAAFGMPADVVRGVAKGAARTALGAGELVGKIPGVRTAVDALYGQPGLSEKAFGVAHDATAAKNTGELVGKGLEMAAELAIPVGKVAEAIPTAAKAGAKFQQVMGAARNIPVDVNAPGQVALRIQQMAEHGGSMPMAVNKFLRYVTDPNRPDLTYEVARDFASNISRLSANEYQRLTPAVGREVANLRVTLNKAVADAAGKAGKGKEYAQAMNEYARAMKIRSTIDSVIEGAKRTAPYATAAGAGYWLTTKLRELLE